MGETCPNCRLREPAPQFNSAGGDFWYCTAQPLIPAFGGVYLAGCMEGHVGQPIKLKLFEGGSTYAENLNSRSCPLFQPHSTGAAKP